MGLCEMEALSFYNRFMRTFVALDIPYLLREDLAAVARELQGSLRGRFIPRENYHMTLAFLGNVPQTMIECAQYAMDEAVAKTAQYYDIKLQADGLGSFGRNKDATLWMGFAKDPVLMEFAEHVREELEPYGFALERRAFLPHVTIARHICLSAGVLPDIPFPSEITAHQATLYKSELAKSGATYEPLYSISLALTKGNDSWE